MSLSNTALFILLLSFCQSAKGQRILAPRSGAGYGISVQDAGLASLSQPKPIQIDIYLDSATIIRLSEPYSKLKFMNSAITAIGSALYNGVRFDVTDHWQMQLNVLHFSRQVRVAGRSIKNVGFNSSIRFMNATGKKSLQIFAPGMIYGSQAHLTPSAIGGSRSGDATWIREDRLPAPLYGMLFKDRSSVTLLDPKPQGNTNTEDANDTQVKTLLSPDFLFGAIGSQETKGRLEMGFVWPANEGTTTYRGGTYPGGQILKWRRRYHPVNTGFTQHYELDFRFTKNESSFARYYNQAWLWAWDVLKPKLAPQNIAMIRRSLIDMLGERVETTNRLTGITNFELAVKVKDEHKDVKTIMGFTGKALETANLLLQDAGTSNSLHRKKGLSLINSFSRTVKLNPPNGEGFILKTGALATALNKNVVYLRSFGDDLKSLLKAVKREKAQGREHPAWLLWAKSFADWFLPQQTQDGGFPRSWLAPGGAISDSSTQSSYTVIPYLTLLGELTKNAKYLKAAARAGEHCWSNGQQNGVFVGGTIDNPDVIDKEAGTLSLEAYLALYSATRDKKWLIRSQQAANFAETWIYLWNVPMPEGANESKLEWKNSASTVGLQLISTGHSLTDMYMSFDTDEFAILSRLTNDNHYMNVSAILLHNTKAMTAIPGRLYDLRGPGWQQEHWSLAPKRGLGLHRGWLPWVSTSQLNGILGLEEYDPDLFKSLSLKKHL